MKIEWEKVRADGERVLPFLTEKAWVEIQILVALHTVEEPVTVEEMARSAHAEGAPAGGSFAWFTIGYRSGAARKGR